MDLQYKDKEDRDSFKNIMRVVDAHNQHTATRDAIIEFFSLPDFLRIANKTCKKHAYSDVGLSQMSSDDSYSGE